MALHSFLHQSKERVMKKGKGEGSIPWPIVRRVGQIYFESKQREFRVTHSARRCDEEVKDRKEGRPYPTYLQNHEEKEERTKDVT